MSKLISALLATALLAAPLAGSALAQEKKQAVEEDYVRVYARHVPAKDGDPVLVSFSRFQIKNAKLDLNKLERSTAELEIDLDSLSSGIAKRDGHLKSADYLDTSKHAKALVKVGKLVKIATDRYRATAAVTAHGITQKWPIELEVVSRTADGVRVRAIYKFQRTKFGIGKTNADGDPTSDELRAEILLTLSR